MENEIEFIPDFSLAESVPSLTEIEEMTDEALNDAPYMDWEKDKKNQRCIIIDIDGTLANVNNSLQFDHKNRLNWKKFYDNIPHHPANGWCVRLAQIYFQMGYVVYIVSGRPSEYRDQTEKWLAKNYVPYDFLYMRAEKDNRADNIVKKEILYRDLPKKELIEFVVDDRQQVVDMWREEGLICLQCAPHE